MKILFRTASLAVVMAGLTLTSCKKDKTDTTPQTADETSVFSQQANDEATTNTSADMSLDDAEATLSATTLSGFKTSSIPGLCNATVDSTQKSSGIITINYNGNSCDGLRSRTGSIVLHLANYPTTKWKDAGAELSITYNNFKVTVNATGKSNTLNGTHTIINVSGGIVAHIGVSPNPTTIVRKIRSSNMTLTFDDGTQRTWSVARQRTWTGSGGVVTGLSIAGDTTINSNANTVVWGTNRAGNSFSTVINTPVTVGSTCGWYAPTAGVKTHYFNNRVATVTFGTDANGNVVTTGCPNHYRINWTSLAGVPKTYVGTY